MKLLKWLRRTHRHQWHLDSVLTERMIRQFWHCSCGETCGHWPNKKPWDFSNIGGAACPYGTAPEPPPLPAWLNERMSWDEVTRLGL